MNNSFRIYSDDLKNQNCKNKNTSAKDLKNRQKYRIVQVKNILLKLEKGFNKLKDRKLRDKEIKIRNKIGKLFFNPINESIDEIEMIKKRPFPRDTWYKRMINIFLRQ